MAVNIPGVATPIATDTVGTDAVQRVKVQIGGTGSGVDIPGDVANGIDVDVTRVSGVVGVTVDNVPAVTINGTPTVALSGVPSVAIPDVVMVDPVISGAATTTPVAASATSVAMGGVNANRRGMSIYNESEIPMLIKYGTGASTLSFKTRILPKWTWEMPERIYGGVVHGIWEDVAPVGTAMVTEW